jgi:hypothetical protein
MKLVTPRASLIPKGSRVAVYQDIPAVIARYEFGPKLGAIAFRGKASKPSFFYTFKTPEQRERYIAEWLDGQRRVCAYKAEQAEKRKQPHSLKLGQVLRSMWGYDQTNINYYQVTEVRGKMVVVREIGAMPVGEQGGQQEYVMPAVGQFKGEPMLRRPSADNWVKIDRSESAGPYKGEAESRTGFGWGH